MSQALAGEREGETRSGLARLLRPASVAVIGGREAGVVIRNCEAIGFAGPLWPVNPKREELAGRACHARVEDLPQAPDAAFVAVPAEASIEAVAALARIGAGGAVCYASGFSEVGHAGAERQRRLVEAAGDMPIIGPNCYGTLNYLDGLALWPDQHGGARVERGVAIVTQSGNIGLNLTMQQRALPLAYLLTLGNQAQVGIPACIEAFCEDERVTAIGLHIEGLGDLRAFERAAARALDCGKPVVALKSGRSEKGARIALSHTASLAGRDALYDAFLARCGVARVATLPQLLETLKLLSVGGPLKGRRIASMSCSGGEASLVADLAQSRKLDFPDPDEAHKARVRATLNDYVEVSNPLDYHTFVWAREEEMTACFTAMLSGGYDASLLVLDYPRLDRCSADDWAVATRSIAAAAKANGARAAVVASLQENLPEQTALALQAEGIAPLQGLDEALAALEAAALIGEAQAAGAPAPLLAPGPAVGVPRAFDELDSKALLAAAGLAVPEGLRASTDAEALAAFCELGGPVAMKAVSAERAHKTEAGALALNLDDEAVVAAEARRLLALSEALLVERMVTDGVAELIVGLDRDPQFGPYLLVGSGGVLVELIRDSRTLLLPCTEDEVRAALRELRLAPLFAGFRGKPAADLEAAVEAVMAIAAFARENAARLVELDVNPLILRPATRAGGPGAVAVDAYLRLADTN